MFFMLRWRMNNSKGWGLHNLAEGNHQGFSINIKEKAVLSQPNLHTTADKLQNDLETPEGHLTDMVDQSGTKLPIDLALSEARMDTQE